MSFLFSSSLELVDLLTPCSFIKHRRKFVWVFFYDRKEEFSLNAMKKTKQFLSYLSEQRQRTCLLESKTNAISRDAKRNVGFYDSLQFLPGVTTRTVR